MSSTQMKKHDLTYYLAASVAVVTFLVYVSSLQNEFVNWDDDLNVYQNPFIRSLDAAFFKWAFLNFSAVDYWRPLTWISHALDYAVWGLNPLGHHLTNNILHAVNTFLVVLLVVRLVEAARRPLSGQVVERSGNKSTAQQLNFSAFTVHDSRFTLIAACVTGLLFGLHPIHVESVAWVSERKDLLCALFFLLSVMAYVRYAVTTLFSQETKFDHRGTETQRDSNIQIRNRLFSVTPCLCGSFSLHRYYLLSLLFFTLALMSKPMAVSLPVVLLILDWYPCQRMNDLKTFRAAFFEKLPFIALGVVSSMLTVMAQKGEGAMRLMEFVPLSRRVIVAAKSLIAYLWNMILPLNLIPCYPYPRDPSFFSFGYLSAAVLVVGITAACIIAAKQQKLWLSVWGYYVITLVPVLGIVQVGGQAMADRYTYLPSLGPFLLIGLAGAWISAEGRAPEKWGKILKLAFAALAVVVSVSLASLTVNQIGIWKNSIDFWSYVIERQPTGVPIAYGNRGIAFDKIGRPDRAIADFDKAITLNPSFKDAYYNRGITYNRIGLFAEAIESFSKSLEIDPNNFDAYVGRGISYALLGQKDRAFENFNKVIQLDQNHVPAYLNRGRLWLHTGNGELAMLDFQKACGLGNKEGCNALQALRTTRK